MAAGPKLRGPRQGKARQGKARQGKARQGKANLSGKCCVARSCPRRPCRPLRLLPAACGMMSRRRRAPRRRSRRARAPAVLARTLASMATGFPVCRLGMEDRQSLGCFLKLLLLSEAGCACCPVRRSSSARVAARRPSGSGVLGVLKNLLPLKNPRQEPGRRGAVDSWWSAQRLACALRACGPRALPCLRAVSSTRARLARDGSLRQPALAQLSRARREADMPAACTTHHRVQPRLLGPLRTLRAFPDVCARRISSAPQGAAHPLFPAPSALPGACRRPDSTRAR
jgi:hypothetical protein